jgi:hypothetical protein
MGHRSHGLKCRGPCSVPQSQSPFLNPCAYSYVKGHIDLLGVQSNHILCSMRYPACRRRERVALCKVNRCQGPLSSLLAPLTNSIHLSIFKRFLDGHSLIEAEYLCWDIGHNS